MAKLRSLSTSFWSDPFIEELSPVHKLLFLYLITNEKTNMLGIYESSIKKISFETGIKKDEVLNGLKGFERVNKVKHTNNYVILTNYMKHQNYNTNMKKSAIDVYNNLPKELKDSKLVIDKSNPSEGFESLLNHFGMVPKVEVEVEVEDETEGKVLNPKKNKNTPHKSFAHLSISKSEHDKLLADGFTLDQINGIYDSIENYKKNNSYKSLYLTAKKWLNRDYPNTKPLKVASIEDINLSNYAITNDEMFGWPKPKLIQMCFDGEFDFTNDYKLKNNIPLC